MTSPLKRYITMGVHATGQQSLRHLTVEFYGAGMMVVFLKLSRREHSLAWRDVKDVCKDTASWSVQSLSAIHGMLSGPAALCGLTLDSVLLTSAGIRLRACSSRLDVDFCGTSIPFLNFCSKRSFRACEGRLFEVDYLYLLVSSAMRDLITSS